MGYDRQQTYGVTLEKKGKLGIWSKKYLSLQGTALSVADSESAQPSQTLQLTNVTMGGEAMDACVIIFQSASEEVHCRAGNPELAYFWYKLVHKALEQAGKIKPLHGGLGRVDPRMNLLFAEVPPQFLSKFLNLERAVLFWFSAIRKLGAPSKISGKFRPEDRVAFLGDKAFYITKTSSEVTRCIKVQNLAKIFSNYKQASGDDVFIILKMTPPEFDVFFYAPKIPELIGALTVVYKSLVKTKALVVENVATPQDPSIGLQLSRPSDFQMAMVIPNTKEQLKKALDKYLEKHQLPPLPPPEEEPLVMMAQADKGTTSTASLQKNQGTSHTLPTAKTEGKTAQQSPPPQSNDKKTEAAPSVNPETDELGCFLLKLGLMKYFEKLIFQNADMDVLECMDEADFDSFGINVPQDVKLIRSKLADNEFMAAVRETCEMNRAKSGKALSKKPVEEEKKKTAEEKKPAPVSLDESPELPPPVKPAAVAEPIILSDDEDLLLEEEEVGPGATKKAAEIALSDDDLDLDDIDDVPPPPERTSQPAAKPPAPKAADDEIVLDEDEDL